MDDVWMRSAQGVSIREGLPVRIDMLRLRKPDRATIAGVGEALGTQLPVTPNRASGSVPRAIWMGPDEWMVVDATCPNAAVEQASNARVTLMVPVGDGRYSLDVTGAAGRDFLAKGVSIDLHPRGLPVDHTAMTLLAQVPVVIDHIAPDVFRLWFDVSVRHYVRTWMEDALVEFA